MIDCNMWLLDYLFCSLNSSTLQLLLEVIIELGRQGHAEAKRQMCVRLQAVEFGKKLIETSCNNNNRIRRIRSNLIMVTVEKK
jgi:hypothetical protein